MGAIAGYSTATNYKLYYSATQITEKSETNIEAAVTDANLIGNASEVGGLTNSTESLSQAILGQKLAITIPSQATPEPVEVTMALDHSDADISTITTASGSNTLSTFILSYTSGNDGTYVVWDGRIAGDSIVIPTGAVSTFSFMIYREGAITLVDNDNT